MKSSVTVSLVPEVRGGPFVFWDELESAFQKASEIGFDAIEIFPANAEILNVPHLLGLQEQHGIKIAALGTGAGWVKQKLTLTSGNVEVRRGAVSFIRRMIEVAGELKCHTIIGSMQGRTDGEVTREVGIEYLREGLNELGRIAAAKGVILLYEHLNRYETNLFNRVEDVIPFVRSLEGSGVKMLLDLFHMNIEESSIPTAITQAADLVGHVHFVDSNRRAAGLGHIQYEPIIEALRTINYDGYLSAEAFPYPDSDRAARQTIKVFKEVTSVPPPAENS